MDPIKKYLNTEDYIDKSVLIVDDEPMIREMMVRHINRTLGPRMVVEAGDGHEALMKMAKQEFDLVILDLMMPKLSGMDMIREIRTKAKYMNIPIVIVSGAIEKEEIAEILRWGLRNIITKPFSPDLLFESITNALSSSS